jgi:hypothetical protein
VVWKLGLETKTTIIFDVIWEFKQPVSLLNLIYAN